MTSTLSNNQRNNKVNAFLVLIFCVLIAIPLMLTPFLSSSIDGKLKNENRLAASWPKLDVLVDGPKLGIFSMPNFVKYTTQINNYLGDSLIFRQDLLDLYSKLYFKLLRASGDSKAVIGKNGWLFLSSTNALENARGVIPLTLQDSRNWAQSAKLINDVVESYGGKFLIVIVPDKPQVYSENLPDHIVYQRQGRRADTLTQALENLDIDYLDLLGPLLIAKTNHASPLYFKTDSHWSFVGALSSYQTIIKHLNSSGFNLPIVERLQLRIVNNEKFSGDLSRLLNLEDVFHENMRALLPHRNINSFDRDKELLLLGDSFAGVELPYLEYSFKKGSCIHHNWGGINLNAIKEQQADIVILQMVERGLEFPLSVDSDRTGTCGKSF